jgi:hypothetical protein
LPVDQVLGLARVLRERLPDGSFVGVGAASAGFGAPLSPAVEAALPALRAAIAAEIERLTAERDDPPGVAVEDRPVASLAGR